MAYSASVAGWGFYRTYREIYTRSMLTLTWILPGLGRRFVFTPSLSLVFVFYALLPRKELAKAFLFFGQIVLWSGTLMLLKGMLFFSRLNKAISWGNNGSSWRGRSKNTNYWLRAKKKWFNISMLIFSTPTHSGASADLDWKINVHSLSLLFTNIVRPWH